MKVYVDQLFYIKVFNLGPGVSSSNILEVAFFDHGKWTLIYVDQFYYIKVFNLGLGVSSSNSLHSKVY